MRYPGSRLGGNWKVRTAIARARESQHMLNLQIGAGLIVIVWFVIPSLWRLYGEYRLRRTCRSLGAICLTFDDGPGEGLTLDLLELLGRHDARATFFMLGSRVETRPELARAVHERGHQLASHSHSHLNAWKETPWRVWNDVAEGGAVIDSIADRCGAFRPPFGKLTPANWLQAVTSGRALSWWTHDSGDTDKVLPLKETILNRLRRSGGGVVLLHDFDQDRRAPRGEYVLNLTQAILELAVERGWRLLAMEDLTKPMGGDGIDG